MQLGIRKALPLLEQAARDWRDDKASRLAASLAFYTALSLAPLLVIVVALLGLVFGEEAARGDIVGQFRGLVGQQGAAALEGVLTSAHRSGDGLVATVISGVILFVGASGMFGELQESMNTIWDVQPRPGRGLWGLVRDRFLSFTMVLGVAFLLLVSLVLTAALTVAGSTFAHLFGDWPIFWQAVNLTVAFAATTGVFALIFKVVPDVNVAWRDVWVGALATAALFTLGKLLIGLYLGRSTAASAYGAAGSVVAMLIWVYYSAQILFFGAELTQAYATQHGSRIVPTRNAVSVSEDACAPPGAVRGEG